MRASNTTGTLRVATLRGLSRSTARSPALRPIFVGAVEVGGMQRRGEIVILLHAGAAAGDRRHRDRMPRAERGAAKAVARHQHHAADAGRGRRAAGFGDASDAQARRLRLRARAVPARSTPGMSGSSRSRSGNLRASKAGSARPANLSSGAARAMATARSAKRIETVGFDVVGRDRPPACGRPGHAGPHRRLRSAAIPRPRRRAPRPTARPSARRPRRPHRRRRAVRPPTRRSARSTRAD